MDPRVGLSSPVATASRMPPMPASRSMSRSARGGPGRRRNRQPGHWVVEPFLHFAGDRVYNPLTDCTLRSGEPDFDSLLELRKSRSEGSPAGVPALAPLVTGQWLIDRSTTDVGRRFRLKYVSFEANTACNQACYFCPVSSDPRADHTMSLGFYEEIVRQLARHGSTIETVSMVHYNEPTVDRWFLERVEILMRYGLGVGVLTNATGLTPKRIEALAAMGELDYLSVNLSTLDRDRYREDRRGDHLEIVLGNLTALDGRRLARQMDLVVLGRGDEAHRTSLARIEERFAGGPFEVKSYEVMNRAGNVPLGLQPPRPHRRLCGCDQTGSRPVQWVHITAHGRCVLCCQDYQEAYVVGDLHEESLDDILSGPRMASLRRWVYGLDEAPENFICRHCVFAVTS